MAADTPVNEIPRAKKASAQDWASSFRQLVTEARNDIIPRLTKLSEEYADYVAAIIAEYPKVFDESDHEGIEVAEFVNFLMLMTTPNEVALIDHLNSDAVRISMNKLKL